MEGRGGMEEEDTVIVEVKVWEVKKFIPRSFLLFTESGGYNRCKRETVTQSFLYLPTSSFLCDSIGLLL